MKAHDAIRHTLNSSTKVMLSYLEDLSDAEIMIRPVDGANHIAWQLGHLITAESYFLEAVKSGASPKLPAGFASAHSKETSSSDDPSQFLSKSEYLKLFESQRAATLTTLESLTEEELDHPTPDKLKALAPTKGALLNLTGTHILMHVGQFAIVRRKLGRPALF
jgi:uncharacterized damage-inducible protein DinB